MNGLNSKVDFEDKKTTFSQLNWLRHVTLIIQTKIISMINFRKLILHTISLRIFKYFQLNEKAFSVFHFNIRSLSKNIDKLKEFLVSLNDSFRVVLVTETWCDKISNNNSLLEIPNYYALHKTRKI